MYILNFWDFGVSEVVVVLCEGLDIVKKVEVEGILVKSVSEVVEWVDVFMMLMFDEL